MSKRGLHLQGGESREAFDKFAIEQTLINRYYNLFMNRFSFNVSNEANDYLLRSFWGRGKVAAYKLKNVDDDDNTDYLVFTDYAPAEYNIYDFPTKVTLINKRSVRFIPSTLQAVNKSVVLGFVQRNKKGVYEMIAPYIAKIVRAEITLNQNLRALNTPFLYITTTENARKIEEFNAKINNGSGELFLSAEDIKSIQVFNSGVQPIIDKLVNYIDKVDSDIKEFLGVNSLGVNNKKEHLITAEVESNDEATEDSRNVYSDCLNEFCEKVKDVFGITLTVKDKAKVEKASEGEIYDEI